VVAGMGKAGTQLVGGGRGLDLLLHVATLIGQLDYELCHGLRLPDRSIQKQPGILEESLQIKGNSLNYNIDEEKEPDVHGVRVASIYAGGVVLRAGNGGCLYAGTNRGSGR
jgi:hypothetical protein